MKSKILKILRESKTYVSGQGICKELGVSRTAVWKAMNQLREDGYEIESVTKKGYRLVSCPDLITKETLESQMETKRFGKRVYYKEEVGSTNTTAKELAEKEDAHGLLVVAEIQRTGKGRRGRQWESPKETGIWMSILLKPDINPNHSSMLTLVAALAVTKGILEHTKLEAYIKWPNDIVVNGRKVCGILTEMSSEVDFIHYIVIGIGINVNMETFPEEIEAIATSLYLEGGEKINRSRLICTVMKYLEEYFQIFLETEDLSNLTVEYNRYLVNKDKDVKILGNQEFSGIARGINEKGELLVDTEDGRIPVVSGEVSVRGLYGYV